MQNGRIHMTAEEVWKVYGDRFEERQKWTGFFLWTTMIIDMT